MSLQDRARHWGARPRERVRGYPCDAYLREPFERWTRAVSVAAPAPVAFRWLCQLRVAPYSYDWLDNLGRQSPRRLTPGADRLAPGQRLMGAFELVAFVPGRSLTAVLRPASARLLGSMALTYAAEPEPHDTGACRLVARLDVAGGGPLRNASRAALAWGDLVMMRKQLLTLAALAERDAARQTRAPG